ncbi:hypothetical protein NPIL_425351, partial [Nephila pilipes]
ERIPQPVQRAVCHPNHPPHLRTMVIPACRGRVWIPFPPHLDTAIQYSGELGRDESFIPLSQSPSNNPVPPKLLSGTLPKDWLMISSLGESQLYF